MSNTIALELSLRLEGKREDVVADVAVFLEAFEKMMTASASALPSVLGVAGPEDWPEYNNRLVRYKGKEVTVTKVYDLVFQQLWEARGRVVSTTQLTLSFADSADPKQRVVETIHRLRNQLRELPEIEIVTAGEGYYLAVR